MDELPADFHTAAPVSAAEINAAQIALGVALPGDYRAFLAISDGGEGFVGENYLVLWRVAELHSYNRDCEVAEYAPGLVGFGTNGAGELFAFDTRFDPPPIVMAPMIGLSHDDAFVVADDFLGLLRRMKQANGSLFDPRPA